MRKTMQVLVEVTVETEFPQSYTAEGLAADVNEVATPYIMGEYGNVVVMTVTSINEQ